MEPIIYIPHLKKTMQLNVQMSFCAVAIWLLFCKTDSLLFFLALGALLLTGAYQQYVLYRFQSFLALDWNGIHIMHAKQGELLFIPWSRIKLCKYYHGVYDSPSVCVLFQSIDYSIDGKNLYTLNGPIDLKREGKKILCDRYLLNLSRSKIFPDDLERLEIIGITATTQQFECIKAWKNNYP